MVISESDRGSTAGAVEREKVWIAERLKAESDHLHAS